MLQKEAEGKARSEAHPMGQGLMAGARVAGYGVKGIELATAAWNMGGWEEACRRRRRRRGVGFKRRALPFG